MCSYPVIETVKLIIYALVYHAMTLETANRCSDYLSSLTRQFYNFENHVELKLAR